VPRLLGIDGLPPNLLEPPPGCPFEPRCALAVARCAEEMPRLVAHRQGREVACWRAFDEELARLAVVNG
jgi:peptide/nickel transport system ATP-binding protein